MQPKNELNRMEDYIVHIYRRDRHNTEQLVGLVELVENQEQYVFHNMEELWEILLKWPVNTVNKT